jgi:DNA mismatch repair protein MutS2
MDRHSLEILEFDKVRHMVGRYMPSALGADRVRDLQPGTDRAAIEIELRLVSEMVALLSLSRGPAFGDLRDIRTAVRRAKALSTLSAEDLRDVSRTLLATKRLRDSLTAHATTCPRLAELALSIHDTTRVAYDIEARIDDRCRVMDSASRELARLRMESEKLDDRIRSLMQRLVRSEAMKRVLSYPNYTVTGAHYVLPVAKDYRQEVAGIVHRTSASGDTLFVEPSEAAEMSAELALLRSHEQREVSRILRQLSADVGHVAPIILENLERAADLCCVFAKARYSRDFAMAEPRFSDDGRMCLQDARHPVLEYVCRTGATPVEPVDSTIQPSEPSRNTPQTASASDVPEPARTDATLTTPSDGPTAHEPQQVVPISVHLGGRFDMLVLTGPNTGGKTVALKTAGLLALMAQAGLHIPAAEGSMMPIYDQVLADIGDEQSIEQSLSTFSSHISRIASILRAATSRSLVLLDELGAGTDPAEGAALGRAILDRLLSEGVHSVVTTHLGDLKMYALTHPRAENAAVEFDAQTLRPTYRLRIGDTGQSSAMIIARRLELPSGVVDRAEQYLASSRTGRPQELEVLERRRAEAEAAREQAWQAEQEARRARDSFAARLRELDHQAADALALDEFRATLQSGDAVYVRKFRRTGVVRRVDVKRRIVTVAHGSMQWELPVSELEPAGPGFPPPRSVGRVKGGGG